MVNARAETASPRVRCHLEIEGYCGARAEDRQSQIEGPKLPSDPDLSRPLCHLAADIAEDIAQSSAQTLRRPKCHGLTPWPALTDP